MSESTPPIDADTFADLVILANCSSPKPTEDEHTAIAELLIFLSTWRKKHPTLGMKKSLETWPLNYKKNGWRLTITLCHEEKAGSNV